jgi:hypothetical protein
METEIIKEDTHKSKLHHHHKMMQKELEAVVKEGTSKRNIIRKGTKCHDRKSDPAGRKIESQEDE